VRGSALDHALASDAGLGNLDTEIFGSLQPRVSRLRVYEIMPSGASLPPAVRNVR